MRGPPVLKNIPKIITWLNQINYVYFIELDHPHNYDYVSDM